MTYNVFGGTLNFTQPTTNQLEIHPLSIDTASCKMGVNGQTDDQKCNASTTDSSTAEA